MYGEGRQINLTGEQLTNEAGELRVREELMKLVQASKVGSRKPL